jgi:hypothetical protein
MAQVWPRTDTFDRNPTQIGTSLTQWRGCLPNSVGWETGVLHDFDGDGQPSSHAPLGGSNPTAYLWRDILPESVSVECWTSQPQAAPLGVLGAVAFKRIGLLSRVSGGVTGGSGQIVNIGNVTGFGIDCYVSFPTATTPRLNFDLLRWNGGTVSPLATFGFPIFAPAQPTALIVDITKPIGLRLDIINTTAPFVLVYGWLSTITVGVTTYTDFNLFASGGIPFVFFDSTSIPALASAGRGGMILAQDTVDSTFGIQTAPKVQFWQARNITSVDGVTFLPNYGAVDTRDEFKRQSLPNAVSATNDFAKTGPSVQSGFFGDLHAAASSNVLIYPDTSLASLAQVSGTTTSGTTLRFLLSQRPPDDPRRQTARLRFVLNASGSAGTTPEMGMGAWVHAQGTTAASANSTAYGYAAMVICKPSLSPGIQWRFELWRIRAGAIEIIASGTGGFTSGSTFTTVVYSELEVAPVPGTPTLDGPVRLRVRGGTSFANVTLTVASFPGIAADGDYIIDSSSDRITSGGEGIMFVSQNYTHSGRIQEWSQGTLIEVEEGVNDLPNVSLDGEPAATESLNDYAKLILPLTQMPEWETLAPRTESGHTWARVTDYNARRMWTGCETFPMTRADADDFLDFWRAHATPGRAFTYTDEIKGETYTVRAVAASLEEDRLFKDSIVYRFDMEELRQ